MFNFRKKIKPKIVVIAGPSGVGKNTIINLIKEECENCVDLVTATTRQPRDGEKDGIDYYFLNKDTFLKYKKEGLIPEYRYVEQTDNYYGTFMPDIDAKASENNILLTDVDIEGAKYFKKTFNALTVFLMPPDKDVLLDRIRQRHGNMSAEDLKERMQIADREMTKDVDFYDFVVVNETGRQKEIASKILDEIRGYFNK